MQYIKKFKEKYDNLPLPVKAGGWFTITSFLQKTITLVTMPIFTRLLTPGEYGEVAVYNSWESIFMTIITLNVFYGAFNTAMVDFDKEKDSYSSSLIGFIATSTLLFLCLYLLFFNAVNHLTGMSTFMTLVMFLQVCFQGVVSVWFSKLKFDYCYKPVTVVTLILFAASPLLSIVGILYFPDYRVDAKILGHVIAYLIVGLYVIYFLYKDGKILYRWRYWKYAISYGAPLIIHYLASVVLGQSDRIMISRLDSDVSAALYAVAYSVSMALTILTTSANQALVPWLYRNIKNGDISRTTSAIYGLLLSTTALLLLFMLLGPELMAIVAPSDYFEARLLIPPIMASLFFTFLYQVFANIEFYYKKSQFIVTASVVASIVNVGLNYIMIPLFGYIAASYSTLICYMLFGFFHYFCARYIIKSKSVEWPFDFRKIMIMSLILIIAVLLVLVLYQNNLLRIVFALILSLAVYYKKDYVIRLYGTLKNK